MLTARELAACLAVWRRARERQGGRQAVRWWLLVSPVAGEISRRSGKQAVAAQAAMTSCWRELAKFHPQRETATLCTTTTDDMFHIACT